MHWRDGAVSQMKNAPSGYHSHFTLPGDFFVYTEGEQPFIVMVQIEYVQLPGLNVDELGPVGLVIRADG